ncbi:unnamed protein product [Hanseniaspora opuntiae]
MSRNHDDLYDIDLLNDDLDHTHRDFRKTKPSNRLNPFGDENELIETMDLKSNNVQRPNPFSDENDILENEDYLDLSDEYESTNNTTTANLHQAQSKRGFLQKLFGRNPNEGNTISSSNAIEMHSYTNLDSMDDVHFNNKPNGAM